MAFSSSAEAKAGGWHSRLHKSNEAHLAVQTKREAFWQSQNQASIERDAAARTRSPENQLARLDTGGYRAKKERAKLKVRISDAKAASERKERQEEASKVKKEKKQ